MTIRIKNIRPGILIVPDASLKLMPGEETNSEETKQIHSCIKSGALIQIDKEISNDNPPEKQDQANDISKLNATDAISKISEETDPEKLKGFMENEKRKTVLDAMKERLEKVGANGKSD